MCPAACLDVALAERAVSKSGRGKNPSRDKDLLSAGRARPACGSIAAALDNISRYRRLLRTSLTELERQFLERRLSEEHTALQVAREHEKS